MQINEIYVQKRIVSMRTKWNVLETLDNGEPLKELVPL